MIGNSILCLNTKAKAAPPAYTEGQSIGAYVMDCVNFMREEGSTGETKEAYAARVYAKAKAGKTLTPDEMNFLARTNPKLYQSVLRTQSMKKALENKLRSCKSKQEAEAAYAAAVSSISEKDPDRDMIIAAYGEAYKEFKKSDEYKRLPEVCEEEAEKRGEMQGKAGGITVFVNENGYQEVYYKEESEFSFLANG